MRFSRATEPSVRTTRGTSHGPKRVVSSGVSSMAPYRTQPGSRSTLSAACTTSTRPSAKRPVKTTPMLAPSSTLPKPRIHSVKSAVSSPTIAAPMNIGRLARLFVTRKATASPGSTAWEMASPIMLIFRSTRNGPSSALARAQSAPAAMIQPSNDQLQSLKLSSIRASMKSGFGGGGRVEQMRAARDDDGGALDGQERLQLADHLRAENVFDGVGIAIDVARRDVGVGDEVKLPEPML